MFPLFILYSPQSSGKTVVDGTNLELQEANTRLRERLARMVTCAKKDSQLHRHTHALQNNLNRHTVREQKQRPPTQTLFFAWETWGKLDPRRNSNIKAQKIIPPRGICIRCALCSLCVGAATCYSCFKCHNLVNFDVKWSCDERRHTQIGVGV